LDARYERVLSTSARIMIPAGHRTLRALASGPPGYGGAQAGGANRGQRALASSKPSVVQRAHGHPAGRPTAAKYDLQVAV